MRFSVVTPMSHISIDPPLTHPTAEPSDSDDTDDGIMGSVLAESVRSVRGWVDMNR